MDANDPFLLYILPCVVMLSLSKLVLVNFRLESEDQVTVSQIFQRLGVHSFTAHGVTIFQLARNPVPFPRTPNEHRQHTLWSQARREAQIYRSEVWVLESEPCLTREEEEVLANIIEEMDSDDFIYSGVPQPMPQNVPVLRSRTEKEIKNNVPFVEPSVSEVTEDMYSEHSFPFRPVPAIPHPRRVVDETTAFLLAIGEPASTAQQHRLVEAKRGVKRAAEDSLSEQPLKKRRLNDDDIALALPFDADNYFGLDGIQPYNEEEDFDDSDDDSDHSDADVGQTNFGDALKPAFKATHRLPDTLTLPRIDPALELQQEAIQPDALNQPLDLNKSGSY